MERVFCPLLIRSLFFCHLIAPIRSVMFPNRLDLEQRAERELYPAKTFKYKNAEVRVVFHGNKVSYVAEDIYSWFYDSEIEALSAITRSEYGRSINVFHRQDIESSIVPITELGVRNLLKYVIPKTDFCIGFVNWILFELIPSVRKMQTSIALHMFIFEELSSVRVLPINGSAWFAAKDVCDILGLTDPTKAIATLKVDILPHLKVGDSLNWSLMSQTDIENIAGCVDISIVCSSTMRTFPISYPQRT